MYICVRQGKVKHVIQKRDRDDAAEAVVPGSKKVKKGDGVSPKMEKTAEGDKEKITIAVNEGPELVKTGFFSGEKFADLPLSDCMRTALTKLEFTTTTKIQARVSAVLCDWNPQGG